MARVMCLRAPLSILAIAATTMALSKPSLGKRDSNQQDNPYRSEAGYQRLRADLDKKQEAIKVLRESRSILEKGDIDTGSIGGIDLAAAIEKMEQEVIEEESNLQYEALKQQVGQEAIDEAEKKENLNEKISHLKQVLQYEALKQQVGQEANDEAEKKENLNEKISHLKQVLGWELPNVEPVQQRIEMSGEHVVMELPSVEPVQQRIEMSGEQVVPSSTPMDIIIINRNGQELNIPVDAGTHVRDVKEIFKEIIQEQQPMRFPIGTKVRVIRAKEHTLTDWIASGRRNVFTVKGWRVRKTDATKIDLRVEEDPEVLLEAEYVEEIVPLIARIQLMHKTKLMRDEEKLTSYGVAPGSIIYSVVMMPLRRYSKPGCAIRRKVN